MSCQAVRSLWVELTDAGRRMVRGCGVLAVLALCVLPWLATGCQGPQTADDELMFLAMRNFEDARFEEVTRATQRELVSRDLNVLETIEAPGSARYLLANAAFEEFEVVITATDAGPIRVNVFGPDLFERSTAREILNGVAQRLGILDEGT